MSDLMELEASSLPCDIPLLLFIKDAPVNAAERHPSDASDHRYAQNIPAQ